MQDEFQNLPNEFRDVEEINNKYKDEFDHLNIKKALGKSNLKQRYNKMLKIMKLATSVSLATTAMSVTIPSIVPIIKVDASEEEKVEVIVKDELLVELSGQWAVSSYKHVIIIDGEEVIVDDGDLSGISYSIDIEGENAYLTYYENGENLSSSLLEKIDEKTMYYHQVRQNGDEYDIYVYLEDDVLIVKAVGQVVMDDVLVDDITYYYCPKEGSDFIYVPSIIPEEDNLCPTCNGEGYISCTNCEGIGHVICEICNGEGYLEQLDENCEGTGECIYCLGSGNIEETIINEETGEEEVVLKECENCLGTGLCVNCNGTGHVICLNCNSEELEDNIPGYVLCPTCNGEKKIVCQDCNGTGKKEIEEIEPEEPEEIIED